jgi:hypothetical protein
MAIYISLVSWDIDGLIRSAIGCQTWRKDWNGLEREDTVFVGQ